MSLAFAGRVYAVSLAAGTLGALLGGCATPGRPPVSVAGTAWGTNFPAPAATAQPVRADPPLAPDSGAPAGLGGLFFESALGVPPSVPAAATPADARRLAREADAARLLNGFSLAGKVSVAASSLPANADVTWVQQGDDFDMRLVGAFGAGATRIASDNGTVTIRTKGGEFITTNPEADLRERLGYAVPVTGLRYWALGLPMPTRAATDALYDAAGHPVRYRQGAWTVAYADWRVTDGHDLPRRLEAFTVTADGRDEARFRLAVTGWTFGPPTALPDEDPSREPATASASGPAAAPAR